MPVVRTFWIQSLSLLIVGASACFATAQGETSPNIVVVFADDLGDAAAAPPDFGREILPILSSHCFACHGPDDAARQADLRLDLEAVAKQEAAGVIVPGKPDESSLIDRVTSDDPDLVMPPPDSHKQLDDAQIDALRRWIAGGAVWGKHWSLEPIERPEVAAGPGQSAIDVLVSESLDQRGLKLQSAAAPHQLIRRLSLDLIGLPPTVEQADRFAADPSPQAYESLVDDLLSRPEFGEHWARLWMDLARYADTKGYEKDLGRTMWPYRDWLIRSLNQDMPLDQMTREQLAGDLLDDATTDQILATAFHRNTMSNDEGGTDNEEFRTIAVKDRVDTTLQVWMGLTAGCAKCHSHKYDPISQREYYSLYAIFNQTQDADRPDDAPTLPLSQPETEAEIERVKETLRGLRKQLKQAERETQKEDDGRQQQVRDQIAAAEAKLKSLSGTIPRVPVMRAVDAKQVRSTRVHRRGNFLDPGDEVTAGFPQAFHQPDGASVDRLVLADWLMSPENTLTARVWANRIWARLFGLGIVETEEDFGALGTLPKHPELLDWLASEYRDNGWSLKRLLKTVVLSRTYRQSSQSNAALNENDRRNGWLSRGARFRLSAEAIRDQALAVSGLLSNKMYGPPVMPPQPAGLWRSTYSGNKWINAEGEDRYRRGVYTFLKRTTPYPATTTFDGGSGEVCLIRRIRTNTPLQALITLNDPVYLEAAGALAARMAGSAGSVDDKLRFGLRQAVIRPIRPGETRPLEQLFDDSRSRFADSPEDAAGLVKATRGQTVEGISEAELASWIVVANTILNLDEFLTRH